MGNIFQMKIDDIKGEHIQRFYEARYQERQNIEYKMEMYKQGDKQAQLEMLKDISSMANAFGGFMFIGIKEDPEGFPESIHNIPNIITEIERIEKTCQSGIDPRIQGLRIKHIILPSNENIIMVYIPRSLRKPHMVTLYNQTQFWIRHDRTIALMSIEDIRESCINTVNMWKGIKQFIADRESEMLLKTPSTPFLIIGSVPISLNEDIIDINNRDIREFLINPPNQTKLGNLNFNKFGFPEAFPIPTINGLEISHPSWATVELFRNGYYEFRTKQDHYTIPLDEMNCIHHRQLITTFIDYYRALTALIERYGMENSFVTYASLLNINKMALEYSYLDPTFGQRKKSTKFWDGSSLKVYPRQILSAKNSDKTAKSLLEIIWNAFGAENDQIADYFIDDIYKENK